MLCVWCTIRVLCSRRNWVHDAHLCCAHRGAVYMMKIPVLCSGREMNAWFTFLGCFHSNFSLLHLDSRPLIFTFLTFPVILLAPRHILQPLHHSLTYSFIHSFIHSTDTCPTPPYPWHNSKHWGHPSLYKMTDFWQWLAQYNAQTQNVSQHCGILSCCSVFIQYWHIQGRDFVFLIFSLTYSNI